MLAFFLIHYIYSWLSLVTVETSLFCFIVRGVDGFGLGNRVCIWCGMVGGFWVLGMVVWLGWIVFFWLDW